MKDFIPSEKIISRIYLIRDVKVMLDRDLAELYGVETRALNQAVRRNINRFPDDFMFNLTKDEFDNLISQFVTSSWGGTRKMPMAFTEHGVAMLSSVLNSKRAIAVNIQIIRAFNHLRKVIISNKDLINKIKQIEEIFDIKLQVLDAKIDKNTGILAEKIQILFDLLISPDFEPDKINQIGFDLKEEKVNRRKKK
jgi:hypothetical protein